MTQLVGNSHALGWVAVKALLLYLTAVFGFRVGERRTLAEMSAFDFIAAVAVGAIVGRVPNADTTSYMAGAVTLITILLAHRAISHLRRSPTIAPIFDHPPQVLVSDGKLIESQLRRSGLARHDLFGLLRQHGVTHLADVHLVIFEQRGKISVIRRNDLTTPDPDLLREIAGMDGPR
jgi:uncharacterized membrane protein YcaP (DUF421 family)